MRNLYYIAATVVLSIVMLLNLRDIKKIPVFQNIIFAVLIICNMMTGVFCALYELTLAVNGGICPVWLAQLCNIGYYILHFICLPLLFIYMVSMIKSYKEISFGFKFALCFPAFLGIVLILMNYWTNYIFAIDRNGIYSRCSGIISIYIIAAFYLVFGTIYTIANRKKYAFMHKTAVFVAVMLTIASVLIQYFIPTELVETCAISLSALILFFMIQNPRAKIDMVTGAYNDLAFEQKMNINFSVDRKFTVLVAVFEDMSLVGHTFGISACNMLLVQLKKYIQSIDKHAMVYRIKNDTFCIELSKFDNEKLREKIGNAEKRFLEIWKFGENESLISVKMCRINFPDDMSSYETLNNFINYFRNDKSGIKFRNASEYDFEQIKRSRMIMEVLEHVDYKNSIRVMYKPVYSVREHRVTSLEAVVQIYDEKLGFIDRAEFVSAAETMGNINKILNVAFEKICAFIREYDPAKYGIEYIGIEVSEYQCKQLDKMQNMINAFDEYRVDPSMIRIIVSEYTISRAAYSVVNAIEKLEKRGVKACLDNYGSGYSNISYVYNIPFSVVKISSKVVHSSLNNPKANITLESTFSLIKSLGMKTAAEGVENADNYEKVAEMSCDYIQGGYVSKPLYAEDIITFIRGFKPPFAKEVHNAV